jgi:hypothetical protein
MTDPDRLRPAVILSGSGEQLTAAACNTAGQCRPRDRWEEGSWCEAWWRGCSARRCCSPAPFRAPSSTGQPGTAARYRVTYLPDLGGTSSAGNSMTTAVGWRASRTCRATVPVMPPCEGPSRSRPGHARRPTAPCSGRRCCIVSIQGMLKLHLRPWIRSPGPARRTRLPPAGPLAPQLPARNGRVGRSAPRRARR